MIMIIEPLRNCSVCMCVSVWGNRFKSRAAIVPFGGWALSEQTNLQ